MNLLHAIHSVNPAGGGVIEAIHQLTRVHRDAGHGVEIVSLDAPEAAWVRASPLPVHALGPGFSSYGYSARFVPWLRAHRGEFDAVLVHGLWQFSSFGVRRALLGGATPYFVFPHGMLDPWFQRAYPAKHVKKALYWPLGEAPVLRDARAVLFTSEDERQRARGSFRPYRCREEIANLGLAEPDADAAAQRTAFFTAFPELRGRRFLLFLGRLHEKKGCDLLLKAFAAVHRSPAAHDAPPHLVFAGPCADPAYLATLKSLAATSFTGQPPITWAGMLRGAVKWGAFRAPAAFVLPSHQENFGFAVVEALACGVPVLLSDKVNIWREIAADGAGLVTPDTAAGTTELLRRWLALRPEEQTAMSTVARRCFTARFSAEQAANHLLALLSRPEAALA